MARDERSPGGRPHFATSASRPSGASCVRLAIGPVRKSDVRLELFDLGLAPPGVVKGAGARLGVPRNK